MANIKTFETIIHKAGNLGTVNSAVLILDVALEVDETTGEPKRILLNPTAVYDGASYKAGSSSTSGGATTVTLAAED